MAKNHTQQATPAPQALQEPDNVTAARQHLADVQARVKQLTERHAAAARRAQIILHGNHDVLQPGVSTDFVQKVQRDYPKTETQQAADGFTLAEVAPLTQQINDAKAQESEARQTLSRVHGEWVKANAQALERQAAKALSDLNDVKREADARHAEITQRLNKALISKRDAETFADEYAASCAIAIAEDRAAPEKPDMPEHEDVEMLKAALLHAGRIQREAGERAHEQWRRWSSLDNAVKTATLDAFVTEVRALADQRGITLGKLRDALIDIVGEGSLSLARASGESQALAELAALRPELDRLRSDNATLRSGVEALTKSRSAYA
jgi:hypothetical protein